MPENKSIVASIKNFFFPSKVMYAEPSIQGMPLMTWNQTELQKQLHPYYGVVSGVYYAMTGMPWLSSDARKAVKTEWFWQPIRGQPRRVDTNELRKYANTIWVQSIVMHILKQVTNIPWDIIPKDEDTPYESVEEEIKMVKNFLENPNKNKESWEDVVCAWIKDVLEIDAGVLVKVYSIESYDFEHLEPRSGAPLLKPLMCPECMGKARILPGQAQQKALKTLDSINKAEKELPDSIEDKLNKQTLKFFKPDYSSIKEKMLDVVSANSPFDENAVEVECPFCNGTGQGRQITEIYAYDGAAFLKDADRTGWIYGYWQYSYAIPAHPMWFNKDEIIYYMANPRGVSVYGYSAMQSSLEVVKSLEYSVRHNLNLFTDGAVPDGVVSVEDMSNEELKRMKTQWENELKGQPHKVVFINKKTSYEPFAFNNREMQFKETQIEAWKQVMANFGVTPADLGMFEEMNRATAGTATEMGRRKAIRPILTKIEQLVNFQLLPELGAHNVKYSYIVDDPVEERMKAELNEIYLRSGLKTVNEIRTEMGLSPMPEGQTAFPMSSVAQQALQAIPGEAQGIQDTADETLEGPMDAQEKNLKKKLEPLGSKEPPKGASVVEGPRGGRYYETGGREPKKEPEPEFKPEAPKTRQVKETLHMSEIKQRGLEIGSEIKDIGGIVHRVVSITPTGVRDLVEVLFETTEPEEEIEGTIVKPEGEAEIEEAFERQRKTFKPLDKPLSFIKLDGGSPEQQELFNEAWNSFASKYPEDARRVMSVQVSDKVPTGALTLNLGKIIFNPSDLSDAKEIEDTLLHEVFHIRSAEAGLSLDKITSFKFEFYAAAYNGENFDEMISQLKEETEKKFKKDYQYPFQAQVPFITTIQNLSTPLPFALPKSGHPNAQYPYNSMAGLCPGCGSQALMTVGETPGGISMGRWYQCQRCHRSFTEDELKTGVQEQERMHDTGEKTDPFARAQTIDTQLGDVLAPRALRGIQTMTPTSPIPNLVPTAQIAEVPSMDYSSGKYRPKKAKLDLKKKINVLDEWLGFQSAPLYSFIEAFINYYAFDQIKTSKNKRRKLKDIFIEGFYSGMNLDQLAGEIEAAGFDAVRADMIARTESIRIANEAKLLQAEAKEYKKVIFTATKDDLTCEECNKLDGKIMSIREAKGLIPIHSQCRCSWRVSVL